MDNASAYILDVVNLRGVIAPVIDICIKFHLAQVSYDTSSVVIVLNIGRQKAW